MIQEAPQPADNSSMRALLVAALCTATVVTPSIAMAVERPSDPRLARVFRLVNAERVQPQVCGTRPRRAAEPLRHDVHLSLAAQLHAQDMASNNYFEHLSLDGRDFTDRIGETDYPGRAAGENIAFGQQTAREVVNAWMDSAPHCRTIMARSYDAVGLGFAAFDDPQFDSPKTYWVLDFGFD